MKNVMNRILLGVLLGAILTPAPTQAQWTVFDPAQYALQIERQIEEANRWLERVNHYTAEINKMVEQLTTMKGVLAEAEKLVLHNAKLTRTMAQIGQTVREVFALKRAMETMIISRLRMIMSIKKSSLRPPLVTELKLYQQATLGRDPSIEMSLVTWETDGVGAPVVNLAMLRSQLSSVIGRFIEDYLAANPK